MTPAGDGSMDSGGELEQQQPRAAKRTRRASSSRRDLYQQLDGDGARVAPDRDRPEWWGWLGTRVALEGRMMPKIPSLRPIGRLSKITLTRRANRRGTSKPQGS